MDEVKVKTRINSKPIVAHFFLFSRRLGNSDYFPFQLLIRRKKRDIVRMVLWNMRDHLPRTGNSINFSLLKFYIPLNDTVKNKIKSKMYVDHQSSIVSLSIRNNQCRFTFGNYSVLYLNMFRRLWFWDISAQFLSRKRTIE